MAEMTPRSEDLSGSSGMAMAVGVQIAWCFGLVALRVAFCWAFVTLLLRGWPISAELHPSLVLIQRLVPMAGLVYLTWAHTWRSLSQRRIRKFLILFLLVDLLPCFAGIFLAIQTSAGLIGIGEFAVHEGENQIWVRERINTPVNISAQLN